MNEDPIRAFANRESMKRLKRQLELTTDEAKRKTILAVLAEEEARAEQLANDVDPKEERRSR